MSIGMRIQRLRLLHGHTLNEAEKITGVSRSTLSRLENGARPPRLREFLLHIARGYGITVEKLLQDPAGDFAWMVMHIDSMHRLNLLRSGVARRTYVALRFLVDHCFAGVPPAEVVSEVGLPAQELLLLLADWPRRDPEPEVLNRLVRVLITGLELPAEWFYHGYVPGEALQTECPRQTMRR